MRFSEWIEKVKPYISRLTYFNLKLAYMQKNKSSFLHYLYQALRELSTRDLPDLIPSMEDIEKWVNEVEKVT